MAAMEVENDSAGWLVVWLEPLGEDPMAARGEVFRIRSDYVGDDVPFRVSPWADEGDRAAGIEHVDVRSWLGVVMRSSPTKPGGCGVRSSAARTRPIRLLAARP